MLGNNNINGMLVRGATLTTESVWDDTDIVHVVQETIYVPDFHTKGGLRLESSPTESLVVKLAGENAGFTATGRPLDINDRIGGSVHIIGQPGRPVVLTSLSDGTVGAGLAPDGSPQFNTSNEVVPGRTLAPGSFQIELNYGPTIAQNPTVVASLERAVSVWESILQDPITVVLDVEFGMTDDNVLGFAIPEVYRANYDEVRGFIIDDAGSHEGIVNSIPTFDELQTTLPNQSIAVVPQIELARANALAIGYDPTLLPQTPSAYDPTEVIDGRITITDRSDTVGADVFDTALHELGHALGFISGVSSVDAGDLIVALNPMDLFRVAPGTGGTNFRNTPRILDPSRDQVFYDGGIFNPAGIPISGIALGDIPLSTGAATGDGYQPSHWKNSDLISGINIGNMSPTGGGFTAQDRRAFDLIGYDVVTTGVAGEWRSIRLEEFSHDRNVEVVTELEPPALDEQNGNAFQAELLGGLASSLKGGDENLRLGFEIHGFLSNTNDVDVYSFRAEAGTEVWFDIDETTQSLDTVVELIDITGRVLASSDDSTLEANSLRITNPAEGQAPGGNALPLQKTAFYLGDLYTTNLADAGMRAFLPGGQGTTNTYHVRVRSAADNAGASGVYKMQVRLQETDEVPGSTIRHADIRFATSGIEVLGLPGHSPLLGEIGETTGDNDNYETAQPVGNVFEQDRGVISIAGSLSASSDVDWYEFELTTTGTQQIPGSPSSGGYSSVIFDVDYADGLGRPNTSMWLFDSAGLLVAFNRDGQIKDDVPAPFSGDDLTDLSRGSAGTLDPFIGPISLPQGTYYMAISSSARMPDVLAAAASRTGGNQGGLRLEPIDSLTRAAEDHLGDEINGLTGDESTTNEPVTNPVIFSQEYAITVPDGFDIRDGDTFSITNFSGESVTYEFDANGLFVPGHVALPYLATETGTTIASNAAAAMTRLPNRVDPPTVAGNRLAFTGDVGGLGAHDESNLYVEKPANVPYFLSDLTLYVSAATGTPNGPGGDNSSLYMVDPFTGIMETTVGGYGEFHGDIAMRTEGNGADPRIFTFAAGDAGGTINDLTTSYYMEVDWVTGDNALIEDNVSGLVTYGEMMVDPPMDPDAEPPEPMAEVVDVGLVIHALSYLGAADDQLYGVGFRGDLGGAMGVEYGENILFEFDRNTGAAISDGDTRTTAGELPFEGGGFDIREQGYIDTSLDTGGAGTILRVAEATTVTGSTTNFILDDGFQFGVAGVGFFTLDFGPQVLVDFANAPGVRDGNAFELDGTRFEFDTGPVLNVTGDGGGFQDGQQFTLTDAQGTLRTFEIETNNDGVAPGGNVSALSIQPTDNAQQVAQRIATTINNAGFAVIATSSSNRVLLTGETDVSTDAGFVGLFQDGATGVTAGSTAIVVEENFSAAQISNLMVAAVTNTGLTAGAEGQRINFPDSNDGIFVDAPFLTDLGTFGESNIFNIDLLASDPIENVALKINQAINDAAGSRVARASGNQVTLTGANLVYDNVSDPFVVGGAAPGGVIRGMTDVNGTLYVVSDAGGLWSLSGVGGGDGMINARLIATVQDDDGKAINFGGLTTAPSSVELGAYRNLMFGVSVRGELVAINTSGELQPIFANGQKVVRTNLGGTVGLAFGTLEDNLWLRTDEQAGGNHGLTDVVTETKSSSSGANSIHFGDIVADNYVYPGGAHGSIVSNTFSLADVGEDDEPFIYFNYFVETEDSDGADMVDAVRVYIADDTRELATGEWHLIATNNSFTTGGNANDEFDDPNPGDDVNLGVDSFNINDVDYEIAELYDTGEWRQARISLKDFVGSDSLKLRVDFSSSGDIGIGSFGPMAGGNEGEELRAVDATRIRNGQVLVVGGQRFVMNFGYTITVPSGGQLVDGETFTIDDGTGNLVAFEFDNNGQVSGNNVAILFSETQSAAGVASTIQAAILGSGIGVAPHLDANRIGLTGATAVIQTAGPNASKPIAYVAGGETPLDPDAIPIDLNLSMDSNQVKYVLVDAFANAFAAGNRDVIKHYGDVIKVVGLNVTDPGPFGLTQQLAPEIYRGVDQYGRNLATVGQGPARRAANNDHLGVFIDDIIIGFASRGELVAGTQPAPPPPPIDPNDPNSPPGPAGPAVVFVADPSNPDFQVEEGPYQVEIRRAPQYGIESDGEQVIFGAFDPNARLSEEISLNVTPGVFISPGQQFEISDGRDTTTFEYVDLTLPEGDNTIATATPTGITRGQSATFVGIGAIGDNYAFGDNSDVNTFALDVDMVSLDVETGDVLSIAVNALSSDIPSNLQSVIRVFDSDGTELGSAPFFGGDPTLDLDIISGAGQIFVAVSRNPNTGYDPNSGPDGSDRSIPRTPTGGQYELVIHVNGGAPTTTDDAVPVGFATFESREVIARRVANAINRSDSTVTAGLTGGGQVDLFGETVIVDSPSSVLRDSVSSIGLAAAEPNDRAETAILSGIGLGDAKTVYLKGSIGDNLAAGGPNTDVDLISVELAAGDILHVEALIDEINSNLFPQVFVQDELGLALASSFIHLESPATSSLVAADETDAELVFVAPNTGTFWVGISSFFGTIGEYELVVSANRGFNSVEKHDWFGDNNLDRDQGQLIIHSNTISNSLEYGINIDSGQPSGQGSAPHIGPVRVTREVNEDAFTTGVTVMNNVIANSGTSAIRYSGDANNAGAVPFGRIVNNTLFSGTAGITVENNASPTLLNNIVSSFGTGVTVDASSATTVIGGMLYQSNGTNGTGPNGLGDFALVLGPSEPLFVDAFSGNFYLDSGSRAIDSSVDSLEDRPELVTIRTPLGIPLSPILTPNRDVTGQLRVDDPDVDSPSGVGGDVFKDRGAVERADFVGLSAVLLNPNDNDIDGLDVNPSENVVQTFGVIDDARSAFQMPSGDLPGRCLDHGGTDLRRAPRHPGPLSACGG